MPYLVLSGNNPARRLRRVVRDDKGKETGRVYEFAPGVPILVDPADLAQPRLAKDIALNHLSVVDLEEHRKAPPPAPIADKPAKPKPATKSAPKATAAK